jgi:hypothetical protein
MQVVVGSVTPPRISLDLTGRPGEQQDIEEKDKRSRCIFYRLDVEYLNRP